MTTNDTKRLRLQRLIGMDETRGVRGDLARCRAAAARGFLTAPSGRKITDEIARLEQALATYQTQLEALS